MSVRHKSQKPARIPAHAHIETVYIHRSLGLRARQRHPNPEPGVRVTNTTFYRRTQPAARLRLPATPTPTIVANPPTSIPGGPSATTTGTRAVTS